MPAVDVDTVANVAIAIVVGLGLLAVLAIWLMRSILQKLLVVGLLAGIGFAVWSQRRAAEDCADDVRASAVTGGTAECSFFGVSVTVPDVRAG